MRISSVRLGTLGGRVTVEVSISCGYTGTRYGAYCARRERDVSQDARSRSACTKLVREARASYSSWLFLLRCFGYEFLLRSIADEEKKKKHSVEYFFLDGLWRNRHNPLAQTSAVADVRFQRRCFEKESRKRRNLREGVGLILEWN